MLNLYNIRQDPHLPPSGKIKGRLEFGGRDLMEKKPDYICPPSKGRNIPNMEVLSTITHNVSPMVPWVLSKVSSHPEISHQKTLTFLQDKGYLLVSGMGNRGNSIRIFESFPHAYLQTSMCDCLLPTVLARIVPLPSPTTFKFLCDEAVVKEYIHIERIKAEKCLEITDSPLSQNTGMSEWCLSLSRAVSAI